MQNFKLTRWLILTISIFASPLALAKVNVFTCEPEWTALAQELGGDLVVSTSATTAYQDPHLIEARPSLIAKARKANLLVCTGSELEDAWLSLLLRQSGNAKIQQGSLGHFMASEFVDRLDVPVSLDRSLGDIHASGNPHVHLDPNRLLAIAIILSQRLSTIDPENSALYQQKLDDFSSRWQSAIKAWELQAKQLKGKRAVIQHRSLSYLFGWIGIDVVADLEPKPGIPPTSGHLASLLTKVETDKPDFIVLSAYQSDRGARWLAKRTKLPLIVLPYTIGGGEKSKDLFSLFADSLSLLQSGNSNG